MTSLNMIRWIERKRDSAELSEDEISRMIIGYLDGAIDDAQMAALLMAGVIRGFSSDEVNALTRAFVESGNVIDLGALHGPTIDKHSTGGVGDVTTLIVGPLLAASGCQVAKLSGRGLGHTGGTLDKLEAIPGMTVDLDRERFHRQVDEVGLAVASATEDLVPADKRIYALRDVTGTVASPGLIAASVMSKKIAGGADHVILDIKVGDGAFLTSVPEAVELAERCREIGRAFNRTVGAVISDMSQPLASTVGNSLEVGAAIETLRGDAGGRLRELSLALAAAALVLTGEERESATAKVRGLLDDGSALESFRRFVAAQGGDPEVADDPWGVLPRAPVIRHWTPPAGRVGSIACKEIGQLAGELGAGRQRAGDSVDPAVGLVLHASLGDHYAGQGPLVSVHARDETSADMALDALPRLVRFAAAPIAVPPLVHEQVGLCST